MSAKSQMSSRMPIRGKAASDSGKNYEENIHEFMKNTFFRKSKSENFKFNSQSVSELGCHSASAHDITCNSLSHDSKNVGIEIKKANINDWVHCHLKYDPVTKTITCPNDNPVRAIFHEIIVGNKVLPFSGNIPTFMKRGAKCTVGEWHKENHLFPSTIISIPSDTIAKIYAAKGCSYIQISGIGLFHTGVDICNFGVPYFVCNQTLRIYIKNHGGSGTLMNLSVSAAVQPASMPELRSATSRFSLDNPRRFPNKLIYIPPPLPNPHSGPPTNGPAPGAGPPVVKSISCPVIKLDSGKDPPPIIIPETKKDPPFIRIESVKDPPAKPVKSQISYASILSKPK
jgi:hypothetical protein